MARFEMTMSTGETILVDHPASDMNLMLAQLAEKSFLMFTEIKGGATAQPREVIAASAQIALVRPVDAQTRQGSSFVPKR